MDLLSTSTCLRSTRHGSLLLITNAIMRHSGIVAWSNHGRPGPNRLFCTAHSTPASVKKTKIPATRQYQFASFIA